MIQSYIKELVQYGLNTGLVEKEDTVYTVNALLEFFGLDEYEGELPEAKEGGMPLEEILKGMLDYAAETGILKEDSVVYRDLTDTKIMSLLMPRPSEVTSRHRGAKPLRRYELLGGISLLSPEYLLSFERRTFHAEPPDHYAPVSCLCGLSASQSSALLPLHSAAGYQSA